MNKLKKIGLISLLLALPLSSLSQKKYMKKYPLGKDGKPTIEGVETYFNDSIESIVNNFEKRHGVEFWDKGHIELGDTRETDYSFYNGWENGWCNSESGEIVILKDKKYLSYSMKKIPYKARVIRTKKDGKTIEKIISNANGSFRGTFYHELAHRITNQAGQAIADEEGILFLTMFPRRGENFGETFIKEAIANWCQDIEGEYLKDGEQYIPTSENQLIVPMEKDKVNYLYSRYFIEDFMGKNGLKKGLYIILHNDPPSKEEVLGGPEGEYFKRLHDWESKNYKPGAEDIFNPEN